MTVIVLGVAIAAAAYFFYFRDDDSSNDNADTSGVTVAGVAISNEIDSNGLPVNPRLALPAGTRAVRATVRLTGATAGMKITGTWFQLGTARAGAEGSEVSSSDVTLTEDQVNSEGASRVSFSLGTSGPSLPADAWLLRVYVNGELIKTSGFVIGGTASTSTTPPAASPVPGR
jgi:hypothetical protein